MAGERRRQSSAGRPGMPVGSDSAEPADAAPDIDPQEQQPDADPEQVARLILLRRLEAAPRTRAELAATLKQRGVPTDVAQRVLDRFVEVGLIDDTLFAQMWVQSRQSGRLLSRRALRQELTRRGIGAEDTESALTGVSDEQERAAARRLAQRKSRATEGLPNPVRVRRLVGALARRGYSAGLAHAVVHEVLADEGLPAEADDWEPIDSPGG